MVDLSDKIPNKNTDRNDETDAGIIVRTCKTVDRKTIREISVESSIFAQYIDRQILNKDIIADILTFYYTEFEPQSCFVAEKNGVVVGYLLGSRNVSKMRKDIKTRILPILAKKVFKNGLLFRPSNLNLIKNVFYSYCRGEFKTPDFSQKFPATLHVNISPRHRGKMIGSLLVYHFIQILKKEQAKGIHFGVLSEKAKGFFRKLEFEILFSGEYSFLHYLSGERLTYYIMGKKL